MTTNRDELPKDMQEVGDLLGLFNLDGSLIGLDELILNREPIEEHNEDEEMTAE